MTPDDFGGRTSGGGPMTPESLVRDLLTDLRSRVDPMDTGVIERAFALAQQAHTGQMRKSGEPYLIHPVRVATTIAALGLDAETIASGLLHDSIEDSELTVFDLTEEVGKDVANLVDGVTKLGKVPYLSRQEQQAESFRKMLLAMSEDIRVLLVKLADRLDNMRTLEHMPREKQLRIGRETMDIYAPLAHRLGVQSIRCELEDLSFRYLEPAVYRSVRERLDALLASNPEFVDNGLQELRDAYLNPGTEEGVEPISWDQEVHGPVVFRASIRTPHQVHRANNGSIGDLEHVDLANYEIITRDRGTCYYSLGILHAHFKPVPGQFRDHIALPRPNRYRALHTTVINSRGVRRRVLIRSEEMDDVAQRGVVAHWKHQDAGSLRAHWSNLAWLRQLMDWQGEVTDPHEFIAAVKADLFADEVYVFTPKGDARVFCKGATPIDFAYSIHTDVGTHCSAARVNGQLVPLRYQLRQGDTIEIIASATSRPRREWLKMCGSSRARARIKQYLRHEQRDQLKGLGRRFVARELAARDVDLADLEADGLVELAAAKFELPRDYKGVDGLYEALGAGLVDLTEVCATLCPRSEKSGKFRDENILKRMLRRMSGRSPRPHKSRPLPGKGEATAPVVINQEALTGVLSDAPLVTLASCCSPVPGDNLLGYFVPGKGIVAHVETCPTATEQVEERRMYLVWDEALKHEGPVTLEVRTANTVGLLAEMSRVFSYHSVNIKQANCRSYDSGERAINTFHASVTSRQQLESLTVALLEVDGVLAVTRVFGKLR